MQVKCLMALAASFFLCTTGCHLGGVGASGCGPGGCDSLGAGCTSGSCGGLVGSLPRAGCKAGCDCESCVSPRALAQGGYGTRGGYVGPLAGLFGRHHRGAQSHMSPYPGPASGPPTGTVTYPYYTTRAPRDFFMDDPPSIGR